MKLLPTVVAPFVTAFLTLQALAPEPSTRVVRWRHGDEAIRLLPADRGFCYVSGMGGNFAGGGEGVRVFVDDGDWYVAGHSCQPSLWVEVTCVEWPGTAGHLPRRQGGPLRPRAERTHVPSAARWIRSISSASSGTSVR